MKEKVLNIENVLEVPSIMNIMVLPVCPFAKQERES